MAYPIRVCVICSEEFELKPDKPGFANRCPSCSEADADDLAGKRGPDNDHLKSDKDAVAERKKAMRDLLYRKDS